MCTEGAFCPVCCIPLPFSISSVSGRGAMMSLIWSLSIPGKYLKVSSAHCVIPFRFVAKIYVSTLLSNMWSDVWKETLLFRRLVWHLGHRARRKRSSFPSILRSNSHPLPSTPLTIGISNSATTGPGQDRAPQGAPAAIVAIHGERLGRRKNAQLFGVHPVFERDAWKKRRNEG